MFTRRVFPALLLALGLLACRGQGPEAPGPARDLIRSPADVLQRVAARYPDAPATAAFTQVNTVTLSTGDITQRQRVLVDAPGRMRIDLLPLATRGGAIYLQGRAISFANGRRVAAANERNPLLLLGFGVFRQPAAESQAALQALGIDLSVMREGLYQGTPVWVIGASPGDTTTNQLWVDAARWLPVRLIQSERRGARTVVSDMRFAGHAAPYPTIPRTVDVYRDGRRALRGVMTDLRTGLVIPTTAFDTTALRGVEL